jgi:hypothetical protein
MRDTSLYIAFQDGTKGHKVNRGRLIITGRKNSPSPLLMGRLASRPDGVLDPHPAFGPFNFSLVLHFSTLLLTLELPAFVLKFNPPLEFLICFNAFNSWALQI